MSECAMTLRRDRGESIDGALVQHGSLSDRAYLMKAGCDPASDIALLERLALSHGYGKLFAKLTKSSLELYEQSGFIVEAEVPLGDSGEEIVFCSRFLDPARAVEAHPERVAAVLEAATSQPDKSKLSTSLPAHRVGLASESDAPELALLYASVFESYPFAIDSEKYLVDAMRTGTLFAVARAGDDITAAASAEIDSSFAACEMTDFATAVEARGRGLASHLLGILEREVSRRGVGTAYTIARATSAGMNIVFARAGYQFGGTLVNNTGIAGGIESMNVWYRTVT